MEEKFKDLFEYTHHFNKQIIEIIGINKSTLPDRCIQLINHTLNAHQIWNARILNEETFGVWEIHSFDKLNDINDLNLHKTLALLKKSNIHQSITYKNSKGDLFENKVEDILFHIINHSTYHRGQIMVLLKGSGISPILSDYIFYKR